MSGTGEAWANAKQEHFEKIRAARRPAPLADILRRRLFAIFSTFRWDMVGFRTMALGGQESFFREEAPYHIRWHSAQAKNYPDGNCAEACTPKATVGQCVNRKLSWLEHRAEFQPIRTYSSDGNLIPASQCGKMQNYRVYTFRIRTRGRRLD